MSADRLYYNDSYLTAFGAIVAEIDSEGTRVRLGHSAFYPTSGGQPFDTGTIAGVPVVDVIEDDSGSVIHVLGSRLAVGPGDPVECTINRARRLDHMQQHTGQHLLSAVLEDVAQASTVSFHMSAEVSTIDVAAAGLSAEVLRQVEHRCNELIAENRPVSVSYEDAAEVRGLRKASDREGLLRIVSIDGLDRSACGGTHVGATGEIGCVLLRGTEKIRGNVRLEFVCGLRAVRRARADYDALIEISRTLTSAIDAAPRLVASLAARAADAEKQRSRMVVELAAARGREAYRNAEPAEGGGCRLHIVQAAALNDEVRAEAQAFAAEGRAVALAWCSAPASVLLACAEDSGIHAGNLLKLLLAERGGRGGGSARMAQGGVPSDADGLVQAIQNEIRKACSAT